MLNPRNLQWVRQRQAFINSLFYSCDFVACFVSFLLFLFIEWLQPLLPQVSCRGLGLLLRFGQEVRVDSLRDKCWLLSLTGIPDFGRWSQWPVRRVFKESPEKPGKERANDRRRSCGQSYRAFVLSCHVGDLPAKAVCSLKTGNGDMTQNAMWKSEW